MRVVAEMVFAVPGKTDARAPQIVQSHAAVMRCVTQQKVVQTVRKIAGFVKEIAAFPIILRDVNSRELPIVSVRHCPNAALVFGIWLAQRRPKNVVLATGIVAQQTVHRGVLMLLWNSACVIPTSSAVR